MVGRMNETPIPYADLGKQTAEVKKEQLKAVEKVLDSGNYILGPEVEKLEKDLSQFCEVPYALGTSSGTDALLACIVRARGVRRGTRCV